MTVIVLSKYKNAYQETFKMWGLKTETTFTIKGILWIIQKWCKQIHNQTPKIYKTTATIAHTYCKGYSQCNKNETNTICRVAPGYTEKAQ